MVTTGAMPVSPSLSGRLAARASTPPVEVLAPVRSSPLDCSRGPVKGVLRGYRRPEPSQVLCLGLPRSERTREFGRQERACSRKPDSGLYPQVYMPGRNPDVGRVKPVRCQAGANPPRSGRPVRAGPYPWRADPICPLHTWAPLGRVTPPLAGDASAFWPPSGSGVALRPWGRPQALGSPSGSGVGLVVDRDQPVDADVGVDLRRRQRSVAEDLLHASQVRATLE